MGLDAPAKQILQGPGGGPVAVAHGHFDLGQLFLSDPIAAEMGQKLLARLDAAPAQVAGPISPVQSLEEGETALLRDSEPGWANFSAARRISAAACSTARKLHRNFSSKAICSAVLYGGQKLVSTSLPSLRMKSFESGWASRM